MHGCGARSTLLGPREGGCQDPSSSQPHLAPRPVLQYVLNFASSREKKSLLFKLRKVASTPEDTDL